MSHSRRKFNPGKCICGRRLVPMKEHKERHWAGCPVMQPVHENNDRYLRYLAHKRLDLNSIERDSRRPGDRD